MDEFTFLEREMNQRTRFEVLYHENEELLRNVCHRLDILRVQKRHYYALGQQLAINLAASPSTQKKKKASRRRTEDLKVSPPDDFKEETHICTDFDFSPGLLPQPAAFEIEEHPIGVELSPPSRRSKHLKAIRDRPESLQPTSSTPYVHKRYLITLDPFTVNHRMPPLSAEGISAIQIDQIFPRPVFSGSKHRVQWTPEARKTLSALVVALQLDKVTSPEGNFSSPNNNDLASLLNLPQQERWEYIREVIEKLPKGSGGVGTMPTPSEHYGGVSIIGTQQVSLSTSEVIQYYTNEISLNPKFSDFSPEEDRYLLDCVTVCLRPFIRTFCGLTVAAKDRLLSILPRDILIQEEGSGIGESAINNGRKFSIPLLNNWRAVAILLGTNRSPFACLQRYMRSLHHDFCIKPSKNIADPLWLAIEKVKEANGFMMDCSGRNYRNLRVLDIYYRVNEFLKFEKNDSVKCMGSNIFSSAISGWITPQHIEVALYQLDVNLGLSYIQKVVDTSTVTDTLAASLTLEYYYYVTYIIALAVSFIGCTRSELAVGTVYSLLRFCGNINTRRTYDEKLPLSEIEFGQHYQQTINYIEKSGSGLIFKGLKRDSASTKSVKSQTLKRVHHMYPMKME